MQQNPPGGRLSPDWQAGGANFRNAQKEYLTSLKYYQNRISHMFEILSKTSVSQFSNVLGIGANISPRAHTCTRNLGKPLEGEQGRRQVRKLRNIT